MTNTDLARVINSDEIQSVVNAPKLPKKGSILKKNPLKNLGAMLKLNPYSKTIRRMELANAVRPSQPLLCTCAAGPPSTNAKCVFVLLAACCLCAASGAHIS